MPSKSPFSRRKYIRSGASVNHRPKAHANLDIVIASTVGYPSSGDSINDVETSILHHPEARELQISDYESDPDPAGQGFAVFTAHESNTETPEDSTSSLPGSQNHYPHTREAIRDVAGFEHEKSNLCEDLWAPFSSAQGFNWHLGSFTVKYLNHE